MSRESSGGLLGRVGSAMSWTIHTMSPSAQSVGMNDEDVRIIFQWAVTHGRFVVVQVLMGTLQSVQRGVYF